MREHDSSCRKLAAPTTNIGLKGFQSWISIRLLLGITLPRQSRFIGLSPLEILLSINYVDFFFKATSCW